MPLETHVTKIIKPQNVIRGSTYYSSEHYFKSVWYPSCSFCWISSSTLALHCLSTKNEQSVPRTSLWAQGRLSERLASIRPKDRWIKRLVIGVTVGFRWVLFWALFLHRPPAINQIKLTWFECLPKQDSLHWEAFWFIAILGEHCLFHCVWRSVNDYPFVIEELYRMHLL